MNLKILWILHRDVVVPAWMASRRGQDAMTGICALRNVFLAIVRSVLKLKRDQTARRRDRIASEKRPKIDGEKPV